ncbi:hypothetical protein [Ramlibacter humi]|uniref:Flagellar protein FlgN n=1 Tax=Ramlibacter humi TaxID=2530451 RepID=A0A4Z0CD55_9BURK|nr:hypothetical protein [Ramlibacter humi]TFZ08370.1 hypothetical protein EZ216_04235 [Ramlibacter humi]
MTGGAERAIAQLETIVARQQEHLRRGEADALHALDAALRTGLALLGAQVRAGGLPLALKPRVAALSLACETCWRLAQRRGQDAEAALQALGAGQTRLQEARLRGVYGRTGGVSSGWRSGGTAIA